jgi:hypothetical protein
VALGALAVVWLVRTLHDPFSFFRVAKTEPVSIWFPPPPVKQGCVLFIRGLWPWITTGGDFHVWFVAAARNDALALY